MVARYCRRFVEQTLVPDDEAEDPGPMPVEDSRRPNSPAARSRFGQGDSNHKKIQPDRALDALL